MRLSTFKNNSPPPWTPPSSYQAIDAPRLHLSHTGRHRKHILSCESLTNYTTYHVRSCMQSISTIVPPELLSSITTHSHLATEPYPVTYNVSASHQLHRIIPSSADPTPRRINTQPLPPSVLVPPRSPHSQLPKSLKLSSIFWVHPTVKRAFTGGFEPQQLQASRRARPVSFVQPPHLKTHVEPSRPKVFRKSSSPSILNGTVKECVRGYERSRNSRSWD